MSDALVTVDSLRPGLGSLNLVVKILETKEVRLGQVLVLSALCNVGMDKKINRHNKYVP